MDSVWSILTNVERLVLARRWRLIWPLFVALVLTASCVKELQHKVVVAPEIHATPTDTSGDVGLGDELGPLDVESDSADSGSELADAPSDNPGSPELDTQIIELKPVEDCQLGPAGGKCLFVSGAVLTVPAGALDVQTVFSAAVAEKSAPDWAVPVTALFEMQPSGQQFLLPVTLRLPLTVVELSTGKWTDVVGFVEDGKEYEETPALPDPAAATVVFMTNHFSVLFAGIRNATGECLDAELCNGKDDDCDGATDEDPELGGFGCPHSGVCFGPTTVVEICQDGEWQCDFSGALEHEEGDETTCDHKDNDCDGLTDEGIHGSLEELAATGNSTTCKDLGLCADQVVYASCANNEVKKFWVCDYSKVEGYQGVAELSCDHLDNDCDGDVDEGVCGTFDECDDDIACKTGHCVVPLEGVDVKFCTADSESCLAVELNGSEEGLLVEIDNGGKWCVGEGPDSAVVECLDGQWQEPHLCKLDVALNPTCDPILMECVGGCTSVDDCTDDGLLCNGIPQCTKGGTDEFGQCEIDKTTVPTCAYPTSCADYQCIEAPDETQGWECGTLPKNEGIPCDDGDECTGWGACAEGVCELGEPIVCDDGNQCSVGACNPESGECEYGIGDLGGAPCDDQDECTTADQCQQDLTCVGQPAPCDDSNPCTENSCDPMTGECIFPVSAGIECEDGNPCTLTGTCALNGDCVVEAVVCNDFNDCTADSCNGVTGECQSAPDNGQDGGVCTYPTAEPGGQDICVKFGECAAGVCEPGKDLCECHTDDDCLALDDNLCDGLTECGIDGGLLACLPVPNSAVDCDTANDTECFKNVCDLATGLCASGPVEDGSPCGDADACTLDDACAGGECVGPTPMVCNDKNACTIDSCDQSAGCQYVDAEAGASCEDGDPCTLADECSGSGNCISGGQKDPPCLDSDICTTDSCTEDGTQCLFSPIPNCCVGDLDCDVGVGEVCFSNDCCAPVCSSQELGLFECGDNGCGSQCGLCSGGQICHESKCCEPNCTIPPRECGTDGCGGSCGDCVQGSVCLPDGACCQPSCQDKVCSDDGCGGSCGECTVGFVCNNGTGQCEECDPLCAGKQCGPDGCGGVCGNCADGEVCADDACCTADCTGKACGDDGCGGSCGLCEWYEGCEQFECTCNVCCDSHEDCGEMETCTGQISVDNPEAICDEKVAVFFEGFEGQMQGVSSPTFEYSYASGKPWTVKFGDDGFTANSGSFAFRFYQVTKFSESFYTHVLLPETLPGGTTLLSFFAKCSLLDVPFLFEASVGGEVVKSLSASVCDKMWHRYTADLSSFAAGKAELRFELTKTISEGTELVLDDIAILTDACPQLECLLSTPSGGVCTFDNVLPDYCFIDLECYGDGAVSPEIECAVCKASDDSSSWSPDSSLCDDADPGTPDICDLVDLMGCYHGE